MYYGQCPNEQKLSKIYPGECIRESACDGWIFIEDLKVCFDKNPSQLPQYGNSSVYCKVASGIQLNIALFVCKKCPPDSPFGFECIQCKNDEYSNFIPPYFGCIKKTDYGTEMYRGYLTIDEKSIVPECPNGQIFEEKATYLNSQNSLIIISRCKLCPQDAPLPNFDKTKCTKDCYGDGQEILDKRTIPNQCILISNCRGFVSEEEWACKNSCNPWEPVIVERMSYTLCRKCSQDKPFVNIDNNITTCVSSCDKGKIYGEKEKICIHLNECNGFIRDDNNSICLEKSCNQNLSKMNPAYFHQPKNPGENYQICTKCPFDAPFVDPSNPKQCFGCGSGKVINFVIGRCSTYQEIKQYEGNWGSNGNFYPLNYCPPFQFLSNSICTPCTYPEILPSPNLKFCCQQNEIFNLVTNTCVKNCEDKKSLIYLSSDGKFCIDKCEKDEIIIDVIQQVIKPYFTYKQCKKCVYPTPQVLNNQCKSECISGYSFSQKLNQCIKEDECDGFIRYELKQQICLTSDACPIFNIYNKFPSSFWQKKYKSALLCTICPLDKPFLELSQSDSQSPVCTRCLDKIRDYDSGRCISSIEQINNPGTGIFHSNRFEYWPKRFYNLKECNSIVAPFQYKELLGLKECVSVAEQQTSCNSSTEVFDERTKKCTQPEMCSLILSSDSKICSFSPCKDDEVVVIKYFDQQYLIIGQGQFLQCSLCPKNYPYKLSNDDCSDQCPSGYIKNITGTQCIDLNQCTLADHQGFDRCVQQCERNEIAVQSSKNIKYCERCPDSKPYSYNQTTCVSECPIQENLILSQSQNICILSQKCNGVISKSGKYCLDICPIDYFVDQQNQKKCVSSCQYGQLEDIETNECLLVHQCKKFVSSSSTQCLEQCLPSQFYMIYKVNVQDSIIQYKQCINKCPESFFSDPQTRQCNHWSDCKMKISSSRDRCIESCSIGEFMIETFQVKFCIKCFSPQIYFNDGFCVSQCTYPKIIDTETNICIKSLKCTKFIDLDQRSCVSNCSAGIPVKSNSGTYCRCPKDKPYGNRKYSPKECLDKCNVYDREKDFKFCVENKYECSNIVKYGKDGSIDCVNSCPEDYMISNDNKVIQECRICSDQNHVVYKNTCNTQCPPGYLSKPYFKVCLPTYSCKEVIDIKNQLCSKECSASQVIMTVSSLCFPYFLSTKKSKVELDELSKLSNSQLEAFIQISEQKSPNQSILLNDEIFKYNITSNILKYSLNEYYVFTSVQELLKYFYYAIYFLEIFAENKYIIQLSQPPFTQISSQAQIISQFSKQQLKLLRKNVKEFSIMIGLSDINIWIPKINKKIIQINETIFNPINSIEYILYKSTDLCLNQISNVCVQETDCKPPMGLVEINGILNCKSQFNGLIFDKIETSFDKIVYLNDPKKCKGVISFDGKSCGQICNPGEEVFVDDMQNFQKCVKCKKFQQFNSQNNQFECVEKCSEGFSANDKGICFPIVSNLTINQETKNTSNTIYRDITRNKIESDN